VVVPHTTSLAHSLGRALLAARETHEDPVAAVADMGSGTLLFQGVPRCTTPVLCEVIGEPIKRLAQLIGEPIKRLA
jgi:hypothetical protein